MDNYKYDAFISYRHLPLDMSIAIKLQKLLENYRPPKTLRKAEKAKIHRVFRDQSELPTSGNLGNDIREALMQSCYLIVICSEKTKESAWCMEEIRFFKEIHQGKTDHILTLLVSGEPENVFPDLLRHVTQEMVMDNGEILVQEEYIEPLSADIRADTLHMSLRKLKVEFLRLAAPLLNCGFDELYQRHRRRKKKRIIRASLVSTAILAGIFILASVSVLRARYQDITENVLKIRSEIQMDNMLNALQSIKELNDTYPGQPYTEYIQALLESEYLKANYREAFSQLGTIETNGRLLGKTQDSSCLFSAAVKEDGIFHIEIFNRLLQPLDNFLLKGNDYTEEWFFSEYVSKDKVPEIAYDAERQQITICRNGQNYIYGSDGALLEEKAAENLDETENSKEKATLIASISENPSNGPLYIESPDAIYYLQAQSSAEPINLLKNACLVRHPLTSGNPEILFPVSAPADGYAFSKIYITPDKAYAIILAERGIYYTNIYVYNLDSGKQCLSISEFPGTASISFDFYSNSGQILIYSDSILTRAVLSGFTIPHDNSLTHYSEFSYESASGLAPEYVFDQESGLAYILDHGEGGNRIYAVTLKDISLCDQWKNLSAVHPDFAAKTEETYNENVSLKPEDNDLIKNPSSFSEESISEYSLTTNFFQIEATGTVHRTGPSEAAFSGSDIVLNVKDSNGQPLIQFTNMDFAHPYYNESDAIFGFINYRTNKVCAAYKLYTYQELIDCLSIVETSDLLEGTGKNSFPALPWKTP